MQTVRSADFAKCAVIQAISARPLGAPVRPGRRHHAAPQRAAARSRPAGRVRRRAHQVRPCDPVHPATSPCTPPFRVPLPRAPSRAPRAPGALRTPCALECGLCPPARPPAGPHPGSPASPGTPLLYHGGVCFGGRGVGRRRREGGWRRPRPTSLPRTGGAAAPVPKAHLCGSLETQVFLGKSFSRFSPCPLPAVDWARSPLVWVLGSYPGDLLGAGGPWGSQIQ